MTQTDLPYSGVTSQSRHASYTGAVDAQPRAASQIVRYLQLLKSHPQGCTDREAAEALGLERTSINARRAMLVKAQLVYPDGFRAGSTGAKNTVWKAT